MPTAGRRAVRTAARARDAVGLLRVLRVSLAVLAIAVSLVPTTLARAQVSEAQRQEARTAYAQGQSLFQEGKYEEARAVFQGTYDLVPNPIVLLSMAECDVRLGHIEEAVNALERYLAERPDAADRPDVEKKIADLKAMPTTLVVKSTPAGAAILLDGKDTGQVTPAELMVERGEHTVEASLKGHDVASSTLTAKLGSHQEVELVLPALPPPPPPKPVEPPPPPPPPPKPVEEPPTTALWVCGIVGGVGLVSGTVLGILALGERSDFDAHPTASGADRGERLALFADVSFGVATMAVVTGAVMLLTSDSEDDADADKPAADKSGARAPTHPAFSVAPVVGRERAGVVARVAF